MWYSLDPNPVPDLGSCYMFGFNKYFFFLLHFSGIVLSFPNPLQDCDVSYLWRIWHAQIDNYNFSSSSFTLCRYSFLFCCFTSQVNSYVCGHDGTVSSPNHTFSWASLNKQLTRTLCTTFACNWQQPFLNDSAEGRRMTVDIISWSISTKVWDQARMKLVTPGSAVRLAYSIARHVTDCATRPGTLCRWAKDLNVKI